jgi:hypothetical protein
MTAFPNILPSDRLAIVAAINPVSQAAGAVSTGWISMQNWRSLMAVVQAGVLGAAATLDAKLEQATSAAGAGAKDIAGKAITQLIQAGADSNKQAIVNLRQVELDFANGYSHVRLTLTVGTQASLVSAVLLGLDARYNPASDSDAATVDEIVV